MVHFQQLFPMNQEISGQELVEIIRSVQVKDDRPHIALNMAMTLDGKTTITERSGKIGGQADRELFHLLRESTDAVLAGTGTLTTERYRRLIRDEQRRQRRRARGQTSDPLAVVISRSGNIPENLELLQEPDQPVAIFRGKQARDIAEILYQLRKQRDISYLLCEGGPTLNRALLQGGYIDELFLTLSAKITAEDSALSLFSGPVLPAPQHLKLLSILQHEDELFLRYRIEH